MKSYPTSQLLICMTALCASAMPVHADYSERIADNAISVNLIGDYRVSGKGAERDRLKLQTAIDDVHRQGGGQAWRSRHIS